MLGQHSQRVGRMRAAAVPYLAGCQFSIKSCGLISDIFSNGYRTGAELALINRIFKKADTVKEI